MLQNSAYFKNSSICMWTVINSIALCGFLNNFHIASIYPNITLFFSFQIPPEKLTAHYIHACSTLPRILLEAANENAIYLNWLIVYVSTAMEQ